MNESDLAPSIQQLRDLVSPDGGDVALDGIDGSTVKVRLLLENSHCVECVMPRPFLEQVALDVFRRNGVELDAVAIDDPREDPNFVPPDN